MLQKRGFDPLKVDAGRLTTIITGKRKAAAKSEREAPALTASARITRRTAKPGT